MKFREFIAIIEGHGFILIRQESSHRRYSGMVDGVRRLITVACTREGDDVKPGTLASMIRQSGLPKSLFRS